MPVSINIDTQTRQVFANNEPVSLTATEWELLSYLYERCNTVCKRDEIWKAIWGTDPAYDSGVLDVHIHSLRHKLKLKKDETLITLRGVGYMFRNQNSVFNQELYWTQIFASFMPNRLQSCNIPDFFLKIHADYSPAWEDKGIAVQWHLSPFVNDIVTEQNTLRAIFDAILPLMSAHAGSILFSSTLSMHEFVLRVVADTKDISSEDAKSLFSTPDAVQRLLAAQRFAALLSMAFRTENRGSHFAFSLSVPMKK